MRFQSDTLTFIAPIIVITIYHHHLGCNHRRECTAQSINLETAPRERKRNPPRASASPNKFADRWNRAQTESEPNLTRVHRDGHGDGGPVRSNWKQFSFFSYFFVSHELSVLKWSSGSATETNDRRCKRLLWCSAVKKLSVSFVKDCVSGCSVCYLPRPEAGCLLVVSECRV